MHLSRLTGTLSFAECPEEGGIQLKLGCYCWFYLGQYDAHDLSQAHENFLDFLIPNELEGSLPCPKKLDRRLHSTSDESVARRILLTESSDTRYAGRWTYDVWERGDCAKLGLPLQ